MIITTNFVSSNTAYGKMYSKQHYVKNIISVLRQVAGFLRVLWSSNKTDSHDIFEISLNPNSEI